MTKELERITINYINTVKESMNTLRLTNSLYVMTAGFVVWNKKKISEELGRVLAIFMLGMTTLIEGIRSWCEEILVEARSLGKYTKKVSISLLSGSLLFISSEVYLFMSLIGTAFDRIANEVSVEKTETAENPINIKIRSEVVAATLVLLLSSLTFNAVKAFYDSYDISDYNTTVVMCTQMLGLYFISIQLHEYVGLWIRSTNSSIASAFFIVTGFHGLHVLVGWFLLSQQTELVFSELKNTTNLGLFYSLVYWHFVDGVWFVVVYIIYTIWSYMKEDIFWVMCVRFFI